METKQTTKYTPGPWKLDGGEGTRGQLYVWSDRDERGKGLIGTHEICVAIIQPNARCEGSAAYAEEEIKANADLIAAAPAMYEALEAVVQTIWADCRIPAEVRKDWESVYHTVILSAMRAARGDKLDVASNRTNR